MIQLDEATIGNCANLLYMLTAHYARGVRADPTIHQLSCRDRSAAFQWQRWM
jgi:hypothetical protein